MGKEKEGYLIRVKANHDCWIADVDGDPGRTTIRGHAIIYHSEFFAESQKEMFAIKYPQRDFMVEKF